MTLSSCSAPCALLFAVLAASSRVAASFQPGHAAGHVPHAPRPLPKGAAANFLADLPMGPPDAILGLAADFKACTAPEKVNLVVGAYRDTNGKPWVLPSVKEAERRIFDDASANKEVNFSFAVVTVNCLSRTVCLNHGVLNGRFNGTCIRIHLYFCHVMQASMYQGYH